MDSGANYNILMAELDTWMTKVEPPTQCWVAVRYTTGGGTRGQLEVQERYYSSEAECGDAIRLQGLGDKWRPMELGETPWKNARAGVMHRMHVERAVKAYREAQPGRVMELLGRK